MGDPDVGNLSGADSIHNIRWKGETVLGKQIWKPGNMVYPLPAVLVSVGDRQGNTNLFTVAWTGTVCTNPAMVYISVRPERYSYHFIRETDEFVINLTTEKMARATDYCGVRSGRDVDKWKETGLHQERAAELEYAPLVAESPVNIECRVTEIRDLGSHHMFLAEVKAVHADDAFMDERNRFDLNKSGLLVYSHGEYIGLGKKIGTFGYSVKKKEAQKNTEKKKKKKHRKSKSGSSG